MLGYWKSVMGVYWTVITIIIFITLFSWFISGQATPASIASKCADHQRVQQVVTTSFERIYGLVTVVCKDGTIWKVK